jgi:hypothetical protein|tara:strand:- start:25 stop:252 length:228 start_codon:yes stop_codon:yes gene_type:complete
MTIQKITDVKNIETTQEQWWMLYNDYTKIVLEPPMQCSGYTTSPHIMVIADTEEELLAYIEENGLIIPLEDPELT